MHISFACSDAYLKPAMVMLTSFFANNHQKHTFHFLYSSTSLESRNRLKQLIERNHCEYKEYLIDEKCFEGFNNYDRFGFMSYYRILLPYVIEDSVNQLIWLDSDMVINGNIESICLNCDIFPIYGVNYPEDDRLVALSINNCVYVNGGVLIFNLNEIRKRMTLVNSINSFLKNQDKFVYLDQCYFNYVYKNNIGLLKEEYNYVVYRVLKKTRKELETIVKQSKVFHYVGTIKPWNYFYDNLAYGVFWKYGKMIYGKSYYYKWYFISHFLYIFRPVIRLYKKRKK